MATITDLETTTQGDASRGIINANFGNLNTDKLELSGGTMTGALIFSGTTFAGLKLNSLTETQRDALTPANGMIIYNSTDDKIQMYEGGVWTDASSSGADASTTVKGITKISVAPASSSNPIAVGDNDPRVPTADENDALAGTSGTPSSSNKYVTNDDVTEANTASKVPRRDSNGDVLVATTPTDADAAVSKTYADLIFNWDEISNDTISGSSGSVQVSDTSAIPAGTRIIMFVCASYSFEASYQDQTYGNVFFVYGDQTEAYITNSQNVDSIIGSAVKLSVSGSTLTVETLDFGVGGGRTITLAGTVYYYK